MSTNPFDKDDHPQPQDPDTPEGNVKTALRKGLTASELKLYAAASVAAEAERARMRVRSD